MANQVIDYYNAQVPEAKKTYDRQKKEISDVYNLKKQQLKNTEQGAKIKYDTSTTANNQNTMFSYLNNLSATNSQARALRNKAGSALYGTGLDSLNNMFQETYNEDWSSSQNKKVLDQFKIDNEYNDAYYENQKQKQDNALKYYQEQLKTGANYGNKLEDLYRNLANEQLQDEQENEAKNSFKKSANSYENVMSKANKKYNASSLKPVKWKSQTNTQSGLNNYGGYQFG
jgi:hypothetical protein